MAGSLYYDFWECTGCEYKGQTVMAPISIKPGDIRYKSKIEHRFCFDCMNIRHCFIGKPYKFLIGEEPNSNLKFSYMENFETLILRINTLKKERKWNFLFSLSKKSKELKQLNNKLIICEESLKKCEKINEEIIFFYEKFKPKPRCLMCNSTKISQINYENDKHLCGGNFKKIRKNIRFSTLTSTSIEYDHNGISKIVQRNIDI